MNTLNAVLEQFLNVATLSLATFLVTFVGKGIGKLYTYLLNQKVIKKVAEFIPDGIAFGDILKGKGKPSEEVLFNAVVRVENLVLKAFPLKLRGYVDKLIDSRAIAKEIERALNERKTEKINDSLDWAFMPRAEFVWYNTTRDSDYEIILSAK